MSDFQIRPAVLRVWRKVHSTRPEGHAFFLDTRNRLVIADNSGSTPSDTDDGPLYLRGPIVATERGLSVGVDGTGCGAASHVNLSVKDARYLMDNWAFQLFLPAPPEPIPKKHICPACSSEVDEEIIL